MKQSFKGFVVLLMLAFALLSCSNTDIKIGFMLPNMVSGRYLKENKFFCEKIQELGGKAIVASADYDDNKQIAQANELISQGVKVLVVNSINGNTAAAIVRAAHKRNVKVIAYDRLIKNCELDYFLTFDNEKVGKLMADYAFKLKPNGSYVLLGGDKSDQNAIWVKKGQTDALNQAIKTGQIKVAYNTFIEDWSGGNAHFEMQKYLDLSQETPDVILSSYDGMSTGVIDLLKEYNLEGKVIITGQDGEIEACRNIVKGYQAMTVYKSLKSLAYKSAEVAMKIASGGNIESNATTPNGEINVPSILLDPVIVDKNNIRTTLISDGLHSEKDVFEN